jgi:urease accessory protein
VKAAARIVAEADGRGGTRLTELYGEVPLLVRRTGSGEVHLVGGAAGPLGGDDLAIDIQVRAGARLVVRTVAASVALPGPGRSRTRITATVEGRLEWLPEPLVAAHGCDHLAQSLVALGPDASLLWREVIVCGRHGEGAGNLTVSTRMRRDGRPLYGQDLSVGSNAPGWDGPAVLAGARTVGTLLMVDPAWTRAGQPAARVDERGALMPLAGPAAVATATAADAHALGLALARLSPEFTAT